MNITLFSQLLQEINRKHFKKAVKLYQSDKHNKGINSWTHLVAMLFLHLAKANSIREVTNGLKSLWSSGLINLFIPQIIIVKISNSLIYSKYRGYFLITPNICPI